MDKLPEKIVRYDTIKVEYGKKKMCQCQRPCYEVDFQNRLVYCTCGAIVDPFEAMVRIARDMERWDEYVQQRLEETRLIDEYKPRRVILKKLEAKYCQNEKRGREPTCPRCRQAFPLEDLLDVPWVHIVPNNRGEVNL